MNLQISYPATFATARRQPRRRVCPLIMVGDPDLSTTEDLLDLCVELGIDMVELCVPFPNAFTDGETLRRAHGRALAAGADLAHALVLISRYATKIDCILLADCSHTLRRHGFQETCWAARDAGAAGILPHGLPPRMTADFTRAAAGVIPTVGTIYAGSAPETRVEVIARSSAFIYLVSAYGRSGQAAPASNISPEIALIRRATDLPVALGFGLKTGADVASAFGAGSDIAIVGSAMSHAVERGIGMASPLAHARNLLRELAAEANT